MKNANWVAVQAAADDPSVVDIHISDFIGDWIDDYWGFGVTAKAFIEQIHGLPSSVKTIRVHLNSPGGDVFSATTIANVLRDQRVTKGRTVETIVDGLAASAASIILMGGDPVKMGDNALVMIHNPWSIALGEAKDFRKAADELDTIRNTIVATYKWHSELSDEEIVALMDATTWMDADEAIARGFASEKVNGLKAAASFDRTSLAKLPVPDKYRARVDALLKPDPTPAPPFDALPIVTACTKAGFPELAEQLVAAKASPQAVEARLGEERQARAARSERETAIRAACALAKVPELADGYVSGGISLDAVKAHLVTLKARLDKVEVDGGLTPDHDTKGRRTVDRAAAYRNFNQQPSA